MLVSKVLQKPIFEAKNSEKPAFLKSNVALLKTIIQKQCEKKTDESLRKISQRSFSECFFLSLHRNF